VYYFGISVCSHGGVLWYRYIRYILVEQYIAVALLLVCLVLSIISPLASHLEWESVIRTTLPGRLILLISPCLLPTFPYYS